MGNGGRPAKINENLIKTITQAVKVGNYLETASAFAGISRSTLYEWLRRGKREKQRLEKNDRARMKKEEALYVLLVDSLEQAQAEAEVRDVALIGEAAKSQWQAAAWRLERKYPNKWGRTKQRENEEEGSNNEDKLSKYINLLKKEIIDE